MQLCMTLLSTTDTDGGELERGGDLAAVGRGEIAAVQRQKPRHLRLGEQAALHIRIDDIDLLQLTGEEPIQQPLTDLPRAVERRVLRQM